MGCGRIRVLVRRLLLRPAGLFLQEGRRDAGAERLERRDCGVAAVVPYPAIAIIVRWIAVAVVGAEVVVSVVVPGIAVAVAIAVVAIAVATAGVTDGVATAAAGRAG